MGANLMRRLAIEVHPAGQFGNQLFQLAAALYIAEKCRNDESQQGKQIEIIWHGRDEAFRKFAAFLPIKISYPRDLFIKKLLSGSKLLKDRGLIPRLLYKIWWRVQISNGTLCASTEELSRLRSDMNKYVLAGYFHSFLNASVLVRHSSNWRDSTGNTAEKSMSALPKVGDFVGIHLRFGDYLTAENRKVLGELPVSYYDKAINLMRDGQGFCNLVIFTDDLNAARAKLSVIPNITLYFANDLCSGAYEEFILLTFLNRKIISNSTFSWWAGYLSNSDAEVIAPLPMSLEQNDGSSKSPNFTFVETTYIS